MIVLYTTKKKDPGITTKGITRPNANSRLNIQVEKKASITNNRYTEALGITYRMALLQRKRNGL